MLRGKIGKKRTPNSKYFGFPPNIAKHTNRYLRLIFYCKFLFSSSQSFLNLLNPILLLFLNKILSGLKGTCPPLFFRVRSKSSAIVIRKVLKQSLFNKLLLALFSIL